MTVTTDTFTGSNGAGAPSPWVAVTLSGSQSIQSNQWHIQNGDSYAGTAMTRGATTYTDVDVTVDVTLDSTGAEQYPAIAARIQAGGTNGWCSYAESASYEAYLDTTTGLLHLSIAACGYLIDDTHTAAITLSHGGTYKIRLQCIGTTIRARAWDIGGGEPGSWMISFTDSTYASGMVGFRDQSPSNSVSSNWDNFVLDTAPAGGGGTLGTGDADLAFATSATGVRTTFGTAASPFTFVTAAEGSAIGTNTGGAAAVAAMAGR